MARCIFCGEEVEGSFRDHLANKHFKAASPTIPAPPKPLPIEEPKKTDDKIIKSEKTEIPTSLNTEKPKRRYLTGTEIITLLQNTNKQFNPNEIQGCPLTKEEP